MITNNVTYSAEVISKKQFSWLKDLFLVGAGSVLLAICAPLSIKLPFTPVPLVLTAHLAIFLGAVLGRYRGTLAVLVYLFQGAVGLPVFALGNAGWWHLLGPRGGYLLGYAAAAYLTGYLIEKIESRSPSKTFLALVAGNGMIYLFGVLQLSFYLGLPSAFMLGVLPFLIGDVLKLWVIYRGVRILNS